MRTLARCPDGWKWVSFWPQEAVAVTPLGWLVKLEAPGSARFGLQDRRDSG
jgi:hypothetical protein